MFIKKQQGFSLIEVLVGLLIFSLSLTALLQYQRALGQGFVKQWHQRMAWHVAAQCIEGHKVDGWQTQLQVQEGPANCQLLSAQVYRTLGTEARLNTLRCNP